MGKSTFLRKMDFFTISRAQSTSERPVSNLQGTPLSFLECSLERASARHRRKRAKSAHWCAPLSYGDLCVHTIQMLILSVSTTGSAAGHVLCSDAHYIGLNARICARLHACITLSPMCTPLLPLWAFHAMVQEVVLGTEMCCVTCQCCSSTLFVGANACTCAHLLA